MSWKERIFIGVLLIIAVVLGGYGLEPLFRPQQVIITPPPPTPCKVKVKVDAEGKLVIDLQMPLGTAPLPEFDMSEWKSSLDAYCASRK